MRRRLGGLGHAVGLVHAVGLGRFIVEGERDRQVQRAARRLITATAPPERAAARPRRAAGPGRAPGQAPVRVARETIPGSAGGGAWRSRGLGHGDRRASGGRGRGGADHPATGAWTLPRGGATETGARAGSRGGAGRIGSGARGAGAARERRSAGTAVWADSATPPTDFRFGTALPKSRENAHAPSRRRPPTSTSGREDFSGRRAIADGARSPAIRRRARASGASTGRRGARCLLDR